MNSFWSSFCPNIVSTVVGIVIGVPIALWINSQAASVGERTRVEQERERLQRGLTVVLAAIDFNRERLQEFNAVLPNDQVPFDVGLDVSAWDVSRDEIVPFLKNPDLQRRLAYHFSQFGTLARLSTLYLDQVVGVASALQGADRTRTALRNHLLKKIHELLDESQRLIQEVQATRSKPGSASQRTGPVGAWYRVSAAGQSRALIPKGT